MNRVRYIASPVAGLALTILVWVSIIELMPRTGTRMSLVGLSPTIIAGVAGGALAATIAPKHKIVIATILGVVLGGGLTAVIIFSERFPLLNRNPVFWYWPAWFIPAFYFGGVVGKRLQNDA